MNSRSAFRLADCDYGFVEPPPINNPVFNRQDVNRDESSYVGLDDSLRPSPQLLWQALTPDLRTEALKRAHLIQLLRQVNPNLQVCRRPGMQNLPNTADKGVQVPDIRREQTNARRNPTRKETKRNVAPGVRIRPRSQERSSSRSRRDQEFDAVTSGFPKRKNQNNFGQIGELPLSKTSGLQIKNDWMKKNKQSSKEQQSHKGGMDERGPESNKTDVKDDEVPNIDDGSSEKKTERQVIRNKETSSGDEDSVVVVLNQPPSEQGLERKYGQFFCRRCLRGWSSRSVWCLRETCKVYIKQTCNSCNKLVNPYLVCRLPRVNNADKDGK